MNNISCVQVSKRNDLQKYTEAHTLNFQNYKHLAGAGWEEFMQSELWKTSEIQTQKVASQSST